MKIDSSKTVPDHVYGFCKNYISPFDKFVIGYDSDLKEFVCYVDKPLVDDVCISFGSEGSSAPSFNTAISDDYFDEITFTASSSARHNLSNIAGKGVLPADYSYTDVILVSACGLLCVFYIFKFVFGRIARWKN